MKDYVDIDIPEELYNKLKKLAEEQNITIDELADKILRAEIKESK